MSLRRRLEQLHERLAGGRHGLRYVRMTDAELGAEADRAAAKLRLMRTDHAYLVSQQRAGRELSPEAAAFGADLAERMFGHLSDEQLRARCEAIQARLAAADARRQA
jgi:hypothetical protein